MHINYSTIAGTVTTDPEIRYSRDGVAETTLKVSVDQDEYGSTTVIVICDGDLAENVALSLIRGTRVIASGRLLMRVHAPDTDTPVHQFHLLADEIGVSLRLAVADVRMRGALS